MLILNATPTYNATLINVIQASFQEYQSKKHWRLKILVMRRRGFDGWTEVCISKHSQDGITQGDTHLLTYSLTAEVHIFLKVVVQIQVFGLVSPQGDKNLLAALEELSTLSKHCYHRPHYYNTATPKFSCQLSIFSCLFSDQIFWCEVSSNPDNDNDDCDVDDEDDCCVDGIKTLGGGVHSAQGGGTGCVSHLPTAIP